jgi:GTP-binding protein EngB required for normal cell division
LQSILIRLDLPTLERPGKTTLLSLLSGKESVDSGSIIYRKDIRVGFLEQQPKFDPEESVLDACFNHNGDPMKIDTDFINWLGESSVPFAIIFTKADKLGPVKAKQNAAKWMNSLKEQWEELPPYFITSSEKKTGRDEVLTYIEDILKSLKEGE